MLFRSFSAQLAKEANEANDSDSDDEPQPSSSRQAGKQVAVDSDDSDDSEEDSDEDSEEDSEEEGGAKTGQVDDADIQILTVEELEDIFLQHAPEDAGQSFNMT